MSMSYSDEQTGSDRESAVSANAVQQMLAQMQVLGAQMQALSDHSEAQGEQIKSLKEHVAEELGMTYEMLKADHLSCAPRPA